MSRSNECWLNGIISVEMVLFVYVMFLANLVRIWWYYEGIRATVFYLLVEGKCFFTSGWKIIIWVIIVSRMTRSRLLFLLKPKIKSFLLSCEPGLKSLRNCFPWSRQKVVQYYCNWSYAIKCSFLINVFGYTYIITWYEQTQWKKLLCVRLLVCDGDD